MATDATGTPTSPDNIPTYNVNADDPTGNGFNAAIAAIQTIITQLKAGTLASGKIAPAGVSFSAYPLVNADIAAAANVAVSKLAPGSNTQVLQTTGGVTVWGAAPASAVTYRKTTVKTVNTTVAATDLLNGEITLAAGDLGTTKALRATLEGDWLNNSGGPLPTPRIQVVVGGTTVLDTGNPVANNTVNQGVARGGWTIEIFGLELGATNSQLWRIKQTTVMPQGVLTSDNGAFTTGEGNRLYTTAAGGNAIGFAQGFATSALDMTTSKTFVVNVINPSASASYETKLFGALVEII